MASSPATAVSDHRQPPPLLTRLTESVTRSLHRGDQHAPDPDGDEDAKAATSLVGALAALPEPRRARGVRHELLVVLLLACCAMISGHTSYVAIGEWTTSCGPGG